MKKLPWKYILFGVVCLALLPLLPLLVGGFAAFKIHKGQVKNKGLAIAGVVVLSFIILFKWVDLFPSKTDSIATKTTDSDQIETSQPLTNTTTEEITPPVEREKTTVTRVIDGDTIEIAGGQRVRYIGIDTPEISGTLDCYAQEAANKNTELLANKEIELEKDISETDKYGRLLRYVFVDGQMINETLVREGFAKVSTYPPDVKNKDLFLAAEQEARENEKGLWGTACACKQETVSSKCTSCNTTTITKSNFDCTNYQEVQSDVSCSYLCPAPKPVTQTPSTSNSSGYTCNCSKTCPQMSSCAEAQYQLNVCGCSARDGDHDGVACDVDCQ